MFIVGIRGIMKIKINNYLFEVEMVDGDIEKMNPDNDHINLGLTEFVESKISIRKNMSEHLTRVTIIHEFAFGYTVNDEEAMCQFFGARADEIMQLANEIMNVVYEK